MFIFSLILLAMIAHRRGIDIVVVTVASFLFYYYPLIWFDELYWFDEELHQSRVSMQATTVAFLLMLGYAAWALALRTRRYVDIDRLRSNRNLNDIAVGSMAVALAAAALLFYRASAFLDYSKVDLMAVISYELKVFEAATSLFFISALLIRRRIYYLLAFGLCVFSVWLGFRFLIVQLAVIYILINPVRGTRNVIASLIIGLVFLAAGVFSKLFYYRIPDAADVQSILDSILIGTNIYENISIANSESTGISAIFNEMMIHKVSVNYSYFSDALASLIPGAKILGIEVSRSFADIFRASLPLYGIGSFSGSMYALGYGLFGLFGIAMFFALHLITIASIRTAMAKSRSVLVSIGLLYSMALISNYTHRSDLIFNLSLIKTAVFVLLLVFAYLLAIQTLRSRVAARRGSYFQRIEPTFGEGT
jgi:hypothetical protein